MRGILRVVCWSLLVISCILFLHRWCLKLYDFYKWSNRKPTGYGLFIDQCKAKIPEGAKVLILQREMAAFTNYYLYPRRLYLPPPGSLGDKASIKRWAISLGIEWVIDYDTQDYFDPETPLSVSLITRLKEW
jgi:hypothetical protein